MMLKKPIMVLVVLTAGITTASASADGGSTSQTRDCAGGECSATQEATGGYANSAARIRDCSTSDLTCTVVHTGPAVGTVQDARFRPVIGTASS